MFICDSGWSGVNARRTSPRPVINLALPCRVNDGCERQSSQSAVKKKKTAERSSQVTVQSFCEIIRARLLIHKALLQKKYCTFFSMYISVNAILPQPPLNICVHIYLCVHSYIYMYIYVLLYICLYICICMCIHLYIYTYVSCATSFLYVYRDT